MYDLSPIVSDLSRQTVDVGTKLFPNENYETNDLVADNFEEISDTGDSKKIAYVDGGNGNLISAPNYSVDFNRTYYCIFEGKRRITPRQAPRKEFYSYITSEKRSNGIQYTVKMHSPNFETPAIHHDDLKFSYNDSKLVARGRHADISSVRSVARRFAEWCVARDVVECDLSRGDILVMDGSLQTAYTNENKYSEMLYTAASKKGVLICGLSKTSNLLTDSGVSLLGAIREISENVPYPKWCIKVVEPTNREYSGILFVVKLHPNSNHIFRLDVHKDQYHSLGPAAFADVLSSLCENSIDATLLGYPYGMIDADAFARVKSEEIRYHRDLLTIQISENRKWREILGHTISQNTHNDLNYAVGSHSTNPVMYGNDSKFIE